MTCSIRNEDQDRLKSQFSLIKSLCTVRGKDIDILEELNSLEQKILGETHENHQQISAQLSIYPLRQSSLSKTINEALEVLLSFGLKLNSGSMSTLILGEADQLWLALKKVFSVASQFGELVMIVTLSNACPEPKNEGSGD